MFFKKKISQESNGQLEFNNIINKVRSMIKGIENNEEKIFILNYVIDVLKEDVKSEYIADIFYHGSARYVQRPFPEIYKDENNKDCELTPQDGKYKTISFERDCIITIPWDLFKLRDLIVKIGREGFKYNTKSHKAYYYTYVDMCYAIDDGLHSVAVGVNQRRGKIQAPIIDIIPMFPHVYSDGLNWYNTHTKEKLITPKADFRVCAIFEIAKIKYKLENGSGA